MYKKLKFPILLMAVGLLLLLIGKMSVQQDPVPMQKPATEVSESQTIEAEIAQLLSSISGVRKAHVVITYADSGEQIVEKDFKVHTDRTHEEDGTGGNRVVEQEEQEEETVYTEEKPFVKKEIYGTVQGVAVVVEGTYDAAVRDKIIRILEALLNVPTHKIQVVW